MLLSDTIIAVSSPAGGGGVRGIVRVSGEGAWGLARGVVGLPEGAGVGWHGGLAVAGVHETAGLAGVVLFKGPRSFTGEDVAEIELPDSAAVMGACVEGMLKAGRGRARLAGAGEFSARAFFNGKMDLTEAEGIAATIGATTEAQRRAAAGLREGRLHREMAGCTERLANLLALVEAGIDFSDEEGISLVEAGKVEMDLEEMVGRLGELVANSVRVDRLDSPPTVVFIGKPNVGKSSLINVLSGQERSLVSHVAGTTRDILGAVMHTAAGDIRLVDVPGEEEEADEMRGKMMEARRVALLEADLVVRVVDPMERAENGEAGGEDIPAAVLGVRNKADLIPADQREEEGWMRVSAKSGWNIEKLREAIGRRVAGRETVAAGAMVLNQRHRGILHEARETVRRAAGYTRDEAVFRRHAELLAAELRRGLDLLGEITGAISPDEVLGRIFSTFCVGK